jgi:hypothetical protein
VSKKKLDIILAQDQATYRNLAKIKLMVNDANRKLYNYTKGDKSYFNEPLKAPQMVRDLTDKIDKLQTVYNTVSVSYNARQADFRENENYPLKNYITDANDKLRIFFTQAFNNADGLSGLGFAFLIPAIPVIWAIGTVALTAIIAYFTEKHFSKSVVDYNASESAAIEALKAGDPDLARAILQKSGELQSKQTEANKEGFFSSISTGLKWAGGAVVLYGIYRVADSHGAFDKIKSKTKK